MSTTGSAAPNLQFSFDGRPLVASAGTTLAGALIANGIVSWRTTRVRKEPRGLFCGIGTCFDCLIDVNDEHAVRACVRPLVNGDELRTSQSKAAGVDG